MDGDLSSVNPNLLELSKDPDAWKEQRRRQMREKIFGGAHASTTTSDTYMPVAPRAEEAPVYAAEKGSHHSRDHDEAFVLQQLQSHKRRRDDELLERQKQQAAESGPRPAAPLSLKEKLLQQYKK
ncbi:hypothetical protein STCU_06439 [Strigomonas culicis]|uniref:Uncharacterized protein n=1 Tax=Strigomonas culicis TaxID=28005 RepID=S9UA79_9TRYP|nr:hypothetical protein STCU_06439 [Strigomonas culicis]|eukprot:EPY25863.1 hypothetical protein STCU_06439 [Strigomonas culicis]